MNVLTLDAGGTNFVFSAISNEKFVGKSIVKPANGNNLDLCLKSIIEGFEKLIIESKLKPDAISFGFPAPANYKKGIIGDTFNLPAFRGGIAIGAMLEEIFKIPVFINNDGDLYSYGEAIVGTLPMINKALEEKNNSKRYKNLVGLTLGTGFGAGFVIDKKIIFGDNTCAAEIWAISNRVNPNFNAEEGVSARSVKSFFAKFANIKIEDCPEPKEIYEIGCNINNKHHKAAQKSYHLLGRFVGDAIANMITLFDGIIVIGGGISKAKNLILPGIKEELNKNFDKVDSDTKKNPRVLQSVFCLNDDIDFENFLKKQEIKIKVPFSESEVVYEPEAKVAYMFSNFDTCEMINLGAYYFAVESLTK